MHARTWRAVALALVLTAALVVAVGLARGEVRVALVVVFPVLYGTGPFAVAAVALVFAAFLAWFASGAAAFRERAADRPAWVPDREEVWREPASTPAERKWGGVVLLGPLPIAFGNDRRLLAVLVALALALVLAALAFTLVTGRLDI